MGLGLETAIGFPGIGSAYKGLDSFLHPERGYEKAMEQMERFWQEALGFQKPFMEAGNKQLPVLTRAERNLLNPDQLLGKWMDTYETSPYAKRSFENAKAGGMDAASAMGLGGSSAAISNIQNSSSDIMNKDRQGYLSDLMQKYMAGVGIGQNIYNTGAGVAGNLGSQAMTMGENMGAGAFGKANAPGEQFKAVMAMMAKMFGGMMMGGAA